VIIVGVISASAFTVSFFGASKAALSSSFINKAKKWNKDKIADKLEQIKLKTRIMPSANDKDSTAYMDWVSMTTGSESKNALQISSNFAYKKSLHLFNKTESYFPTLNLNPEYVPYGDSKNYCLNLAWSPAQMWRIQSMYKQVTEQPMCIESENWDFKWQGNDTRAGVDIPVWRQSEEEISCSTTMTCKMACHGVYKEGPKGSKGKCYNYEVVTNVCILVRPIINVDLVEEEWQFVGGCYDNDQIVMMEKGQAGKIYKFNDINIEVRADEDPYLAVAKKKELK
jgi:hypothetical protein